MRSTTYAFPALIRIQIAFDRIYPQSVTVRVMYSQMKVLIVDDNHKVRALLRD